MVFTLLGVGVFGHATVSNNRIGLQNCTDDATDHSSACSLVPRGISRSGCTTFGATSFSFAQSWLVSRICSKSTPPADTNFNLGIVTLFPILYIPVLSTVVFKHKGISWVSSSQCLIPDKPLTILQEWAIVFIAAILFFLGVETWKFAKRVYFRRQAKKSNGGTSDDLESRMFARYLSTDSRDSEGEKNEKMAGGGVLA
jgi:hypothetical protein